jgi:hypothetical protein
MKARWMVLLLLLACATPLVTQQTSGVPQWLLKTGSSPAWLRYLGSGDDGAASSAAGPMGGDLYFTDFTVAAGSQVNVVGTLIVHSSGPCTINGTILGAGAPGTWSGYGLTISTTVSGGAITGGTIDVAGNGYTTGQVVYVAGGFGGSFTISSQTGGVPSAISLNRGGSGYTATTGAATDFSGTYGGAGAGGGSGGGGGGGSSAGFTGGNSAQYLMETVAQGVPGVQGGFGGAASGGAGAAGQPAFDAQGWSIIPISSNSFMGNLAALAFRTFIADGWGQEGKGIGGAQGGWGSQGAPPGNGGSAVYLICQSITGNGAINVTGGVGANAVANNMGGGGGGGGGAIILSSQRPVTFTGMLNVAGGAGGTCGSFTGCGPGGAGGPGFIAGFSGWGK